MAGAATSALVANTVAVSPTLATYLTVWAATTAARPSPASNLNASPGEVVANATITPMGPANTFKIYNNKGLTHTVMDVTGSFEAYTPPPAVQSLQKSLRAESGSSVLMAHSPSGQVGPVGRAEQARNPSPP